jgi:hypothetical protein
MAYTKITLEAVVQDDDTEFLLQALTDAMENYEERMTVYSREMVTAPTGVPENAAEIAANMSQR